MTPCLLTPEGRSSLTEAPQKPTKPNGFARSRLSDASLALDPNANYLGLERMDFASIDLSREQANATQGDQPTAVPPFLLLPTCQTEVHAMAVPSHGSRTSPVRDVSKPRLLRKKNDSSRNPTPFSLRPRTCSENSSSPIHLAAPKQTPRLLPSRGHYWPLSPSQQHTNNKKGEQNEAVDMDMQDINVSIDENDTPAYFQTPRHFQKHSTTHLDSLEPPCLFPRASPSEFVVPMNEVTENILLPELTY